MPALKTPSDSDISMYSTNPKSIIPRNIGILRSWCKDNQELNEMFHEIVASSEDEWIYSDKDLQGLEYDLWMSTIKTAHVNGDFKTSIWYR